MGKNATRWHLIVFLTTLRHEFKKRLSDMNETEIYKIAKELGYSNSKTTVINYCHLIDSVFDDVSKTFKSLNAETIERIVEKWQRKLRF